VTASRFELARTIAELLMYANHAINFYLYCATGQKFRRLYRALYLHCAITCTALPGKSSTTCSVLSACTVPFPYCFYLCCATGQNFYHHYLYCFYLSCATGQKFRHQLIWMVCYSRRTYWLPGGRCVGSPACDDSQNVLVAGADDVLVPRHVTTHRTYWLPGRMVCWFPGM